MHHKIWCPWRGLNTRPLPYQGSALPLSYMGAKLRLCCHAPVGKRVTTGAGEGNRTLVVSLEGFCSTIELHPPGTSDKNSLPHHNPRIRKHPDTQQIQALTAANKTWWRGKDSNLRRLSQQIYSLPPLTAREPLRTKPTIILGLGLAVNESAWKMLCPDCASFAQIGPPSPKPAPDQPPETIRPASKGKVQSPVDAPG
jgi:hypothetical protein